MTHLSDPLTPARLSEIRARAEAATAGPWVDDDACDVWTEHEDMFGGTVHTVDDNYPRGGFNPREDAAFIAAARQDVPDLLSEVDRLTVALEVADKAPHDWEHCGLFDRAGHRYVQPAKCTCWKADYDAAKEAI